MDLSDIVLLLGAGGVIAYLWKSSVQEHTHGSEESRLTETNLMSWLFDKPTLQGESANTRRSNRLSYLSSIHDEPLQEHLQAANSSGLNSLSSGASPRRFLKHRLFDIRQLRNTSRFTPGVKRDVPCDKSSYGDNESQTISEQKAVDLNTEERIFSHIVSSFDSEKCKFKNRKYLPTARLYGDTSRGTPDGQERSTPSPETKSLNSVDLDEKFLLNRAAVNPKSFPISGSMLEIMQNAKEVRRLIRETSLDSQASDFCFDIPSRELQDVNSRADEIFQSCQSEGEESLPPLSLYPEDSKDLFKLVLFSERESSVFSEYSDHWKDDKLYKVALGHSSYASEAGDDIGSCLDSWEWDDECYFEGDLESQNVEAVSSAQQEVLLPDSEELDLEMELKLKDSSIYSSKEPSVTEDYQLLCRLPPSGRSSVESLNEPVQFDSTKEYGLILTP